MVDPKIIEIIKQFLAALPANGIHPVAGVLFGSHARGEAGEWSDIDVLVIAPEFDEFRPIPPELATRLWTTASSVDLRLEALPCGVQEWNQPAARPMISIATREGFKVAA